jgi:hypothetical protein
MTAWTTLGCLASYDPQTVPTKMLTFEYGPDNVVEINLDATGLRDLIDVLSRLTPGDHEHLSTPSWGGHTLTEHFPNPDLVPVHQVTIQLSEDAPAGR